MSLFSGITRCDSAPPSTNRVNTRKMFLNRNTPWFNDFSRSIYGLATFFCNFSYNCFSSPSGKWMYEVFLGSKGIMQLGWATVRCRFTNEVIFCLLLFLRLVRCFGMNCDVSLFNLQTYTTLSIFVILQDPKISRAISSIFLLFCQLSGIF